MDLVKNINNSLSNTLEVIVLLVVLVFLDGKGVAYEKRSQKSSAATSSSASLNVYTAQLYNTKFEKEVNLHIQDMKICSMLKPVSILVYKFHL